MQSIDIPRSCTSPSISSCRLTCYSSQLRQSNLHMTQICSTVQLSFNNLSFTSYATFSTNLYCKIRMTQLTFLNPHPQVVFKFFMSPSFVTVFVGGHILQRNSSNCDILSNFVLFTNNLACSVISVT